MPRIFNHKAIQNFQDEVRVKGSKLVIDGVTVTATAAGINTGTVAGLTATGAELNKNAGVTAGTASASKTAVLGTTKNLDFLRLAQLELGPAPTDTFASSMTIDVTKSLHVVSAANGTSATVTFTPSAAGTAGDLLIIVTETDASGTVTATFASTFHSSGTQATTLSRFSSIVFISDGTRWIEVCRTTALA